MSKEDREKRKFWGVEVDGAIMTVSPSRNAMIAYCERYNSYHPGAAELVEVHVQRKDGSGRSVQGAS